MKCISVLAFAAALVACGKKLSDPSLGGMRNGTWVRAEAKRSGKPIVWELRQDVAVNVAKPDLLIVSWHYSTQQVDGRPSERDEQNFAEFEQRLVRKIGEAGTLAAVLTYDQQHDWYFFGVSGAIERAHAVPEESERAAVAIEIEPGAAAEFHSALNARADRH